MSTPPATNIIFSYVPLLLGPPGVAYMGKEALDAAEGMSAALEQLPSGSAKACLWMMDNNGVRAILAMEECDAIAEHLKIWAEGKPEDWFKFHFLEKGPAYAVALFPDFRKSSDRWKYAFQLRHGFPPVPGSESLIFRPLHCVAKTKTAFDQVKKHFKSTVRVGLVGADEVSPENYMLEDDQIRWLGDFRAVREKSKKGMAAGWLESNIDEMLKEG